MGQGVGFRIADFGIRMCSSFLRVLRAPFFVRFVVKKEQQSIAEGLKK